uniref:Fibroblast growth factor binding protein 1 n=1 Tax=Nothobranchius furzeri TaxID=105023 RepID=A0A1A7ZIK9_NOTFU
MALLTNFTVLLVLACISHQMILGGCQKSHGRRGRGNRGQHKERSGQKVGRQTKSVSVSQMMGKWVTKDASECSWIAAGETLITLNVTCRKGDISISCEYAARPSLCPQYASSEVDYWVQISKALKKHKNLCQDKHGLLRAGMCRGAAREAHFRLRVSQMEKNRFS